MSGNAKWVWISVVFLLTASTSGSVGIAQEDDLLAGLPDLVEKMREEWLVPGVGVAVIKEGEIVFKRGFGLRDIGSKLPITADTLFAIGSTTKAFTALALGILVDEGKIEWDEPVREYMPDFVLYDEYATLHATPRDLVTHRTGLPRHDLVWYRSTVTREELYHALRHLEPSAGFRSLMQYNNLIYMTAGYLVGWVSGGTWEVFITERIFKPLGMSRSVTCGPPEGVEDVASPHSSGGPIVTKIPYYRDCALGPAGTIYSSVEDACKWLLFNMGDGTFEGAKIVSEEILRLMHTPQVVMQFGESEELPIAAYGMGWVIQVYRGQKYVWHNGGIDGFYTLIAFLPYEKLGVIVFTNANQNPLPEIVSRWIFDHALGLDEINWNTHYKEQQARTREARTRAFADRNEGRKEGTSPSHPLEGYVGFYSHPAYLDFKVDLADGKLRGSFRGFKVTMEHFHYDIFHFNLGTLGNLKVTFSLNADGDIESLSIPLQDGVDPIVFKRKPEE